MLFICDIHVRGGVIVHDLELKISDLMLGFLCRLINFLFMRGVLDVLSV